MFPNEFPIHIPLKDPIKSALCCQYNSRWHMEQINWYKHQLQPGMPETSQTHSGVISPYKSSYQQIKTYASSCSTLSVDNGRVPEKTWLPRICNGQRASNASHQIPEEYCTFWWWFMQSIKMVMTLGLFIVRLTTWIYIYIYINIHELSYIFSHTQIWGSIVTQWTGLSTATLQIGSEIKYVKCTWQT